MATPARTINGELTPFGKQAVLALNLVKQHLAHERLGVPEPTPEPSPEVRETQRLARQAMTRLRRNQELAEKTVKRINAKSRAASYDARQKADAEFKALVAAARAKLTPDSEKEAFRKAKEAAYAPGPYRKAI